jgi:Uma2 family endonuclease
MEPARKDRLSLSEYNQLEEREQQRYEYHQGEVFAMAGGDPKHGAIAGNVTRLLGNALLDKDCTVFTSDVKFYLEAEDRSCYPDVSVVCGPPQRSEKDTRALTNPVLLIEVLSETTEGYDRGTKFRYYSTMPTFLEYVLIDQDSWNVETRYRPSPNERWQLELFSGEDTEIPLRSLGITLPMAELYRKTEGL